MHEGNDVGRHTVNLHGIRTAAGFELQRRAVDGAVGDRRGEAKTTYRARAKRAAHAGNLGVRAQVNAVHGAAITTLARFDHQAAQLREVARQALERRNFVVIDAVGGEQ